MARSNFLVIVGVLALALADLASAQSVSGQRGLGSPPGTPTAVRLMQPELGPHPTVTQLNSVQIKGVALDATEVELTAPGIPSGKLLTPVIATRFNHRVPLLPNQLNPIVVRSMAPGGLLSAPVNTSVAQDTTGPVLAIYSPVDMSSSLTPTISVVGRAVDTLGGIASVKIAGIEATLTSGGPGVADFSLNGFVLQSAGVQTVINVDAIDGSGTITTQTVTVTYQPPPPMTPAISYESGDLQYKQVNLELDDAIVVKVLQSEGSPMIGQPVDFSVDVGGGLLSCTSGGPRTPQVTVITDGTGLAQAYWSMGQSAVPPPTPPGNVLIVNSIATATSTGVFGQVTFQASATAGVQNEIHVISGDDQTVQVANVAPDSLRVRVKNGTLGLSGIAVTFAVFTGGGSISGQPSINLFTDLDGYAEVDFKLGGAPGPHVVDTTITTASAPATFSLTGVQSNPTQPTSLTGVVFDQADHPLGGVTVEVDDGAAMASATTDVLGRFEFSSLPFSGPVTLQALGGTTATVSGQPLVGTYPDHLQPLDLVPNGRTELPRPIALPLRQPGNVALFDNTSTVVLTLPEVEGFQMTVHAGSMKLADGTIPNAGNPVTLRLNQVHHDKVGFNIPSGSEAVFAFVLEPFGAQFGPETGIPGAQTIDLEMPNVLGLPPGAQVDFYGFDPGTGAISIVGSGNVVGNGSIVATGAGSGIKAGGCVLKGGFFGQSLTYEAPDPCTTAAGEIPTTTFLPVAGGTIRDDACGSGAFGALRGSVPNPGVDISGSLGAGVVTVYDGTVFAVQSSCVADPGCAGASAGCGSGYGNFVVIEHPLVVPSLSRFYTAYCQLDTVFVNPGDFVTAGMSLGTLGQTGNANPACLPCAVTPYVHFELSASVPPLTAEIPRCDPSTYLVNLAAPTSTLASPDFENFSGQTVLQASGEIGFPAQATLARINNVAAPTLGKGTLRSTWIVGDQLEELSSPFDDLSGGVTLTAQEVDPDPDGAPVHIDASAASPLLTSLGQTTQLTVSAFNEQNVSRDVTARAEGTFYRTSNAAIVTVGNTNLDAGLVTAQGFGTAYVTAVNEGTLTTLRFDVVLPTTIVQGFVVGPGAAPVEGALVTVFPGNLTGATDMSGAFSILDVPATLGNLTVFADAVLALVPKTVTVTGVVPIQSGVTDAGTLQLEDAVYWNTDGSGSWSVGANWSGGVAPLPGQNVVIDRASASPTITINTDSGLFPIKSLRCKEHLVLGMNDTAQRFEVTQPYQIDGAFELQRGTLGSSTLVAGVGGSVEVLGPQSVVLDSMTLAADAELSAAADLTIQGGSTLDATLRRTPGTTGTATIDVNGSTLNGSGVIDATSPTGALDLDFNTSVVGAGIVVHGEGAVSFATLTNFGAFTSEGTGFTFSGTLLQNFGLVESAMGVPLTLDCDLDNQGLLQAIDATVSLNGTFDLAGLHPIQFDGSDVFLLDDAVFDLTNQIFQVGGNQGEWTCSGTILNGEIRSDAGSTLTLTGTPTLDNISLSADVLMNAAGTALQVPRDLTLNGSTVTMSAPGPDVRIEWFGSGSKNLLGTGAVLMSGGTADVLLRSNMRLTIAPGVTISGGGTIDCTMQDFDLEGSLTVDAGQTFEVVSNHFRNRGTVDVHGTLRLFTELTTENTVLIPVGGHVDVTPSRHYRQKSGLTVLDGLLSTDNTDKDVTFDGGVLSGTGTVDTRKLVMSGTLRPGGLTATGTLDVAGDFQMKAGGVLEIELAGPSSSDLLNIHGARSLEATLTVSLLSGYDPSTGATIIQSTSGSGSFDAVILPPLCCNKSFSVSYSATQVDLVLNP
jgi:hypothetical protein